VPRRRSAEAGLVSFGLLSIGVAIVGPLLAAQEAAIPVVVVLAFLAGSAYAATTVSAQTALFEHMPPAVRGRVFGVLASIVSAASLLPILIAGPLADNVSAPVVLSIVAAAVIATGIASARLFGPTESEANSTEAQGSQSRTGGPSD
jgi:MFS family permease